jgi:hypothetical protein
LLLAACCPPELDPYTLSWMSRWPDALAGDATEVGVRRVALHAAQVRVVREVEDLATELHPPGAAHVEVLEERDVPLLSPGLRRRLRGALPKRPFAGRHLRNAAGLNQKLLSLPVRELPVRARVRVADEIDRLAEAAVAHARAVVAGLVIENGVPLRRNVAPEICQPPSTFCTMLAGLRKNGRS